MNDPNPQVEQILTALATTTEQLKALEARLDRLENPLPVLPALPGLSDEERQTSERNFAADWAELMDGVAEHRRRRSQPGYAERKGERKRLLREWGYDV